MNLNTTWPSRGRASNPVLKAGLILFATLTFVLATSGQARAADCTTVDDCFNAAAWQKAVANDYSKKAFFAGADAQNNFKAAADWHNKSVGAFLSGNGSAAQWYQAIANDYARKAAASSTAANDFAAKAKLTDAAADANYNRGIFIGGGIQADSDYPAGPGVEQGACDPGEVCTAARRPSCRKNLVTPLYLKVKDRVIYRAKVNSTWCWRGVEIVSRNTDYGWHGLTDTGKNMGFKEMSPIIEPHSGCHDKQAGSIHINNWDCLVRIQYRMEKTVWCGNPFNAFRCTQTAGGCIAIRIYGDSYTPNYHRNKYAGECGTTN